MADFLSTLQRFESGGRNIPNTTQGTSSGQAQGYNQITTGTWKEFGGTAYAPTPLQATQDQQNAIAAKIPLKRWAPETLAYLRNNGFSLNPNATLADNIAANHGTLGTAPSPHSTTPEAPGPMDPSAQAGGPGATLGTPGSTVNPPIPTTPGTTINSTPPGVTQGQWADLSKNVKSFGKTLGLPDDDAKDGQQQMRPLQAPPAPGARNVSSLLGGPGGIGQGQVSPSMPSAWPRLISR